MVNNNKKPIVNLSYWTFPKGEMFSDFQGVSIFEQELKKDYDINIESHPTDTLGGGLYELAVQIVSDFDFKSYALKS